MEGPEVFVVFDVYTRGAWIFDKFVDISDKLKVPLVGLT